MLEARQTNTIPAEVHELEAYVDMNFAADEHTLSVRWSNVLKKSFYISGWVPNPFRPNTVSPPIVGLREFLCVSFDRTICPPQPIADARYHRLTELLPLAGEEFCWFVANIADDDVRAHFLTNHDIPNLDRYTRFFCMSRSYYTAALINLLGWKPTP